LNSKEKIKRKRIENSREKGKSKEAEPPFSGIIGPASLASPAHPLSLAL
jgi:hypothetical protein